MQTVITMTSKGQFTLPASARRALQLKQGDKLVFTLDSQQRAATITKPQTIQDLSNRISRYVRPGTKPVLSANEYYQTRNPRA